MPTHYVPLPGHDSIHVTIGDGVYSEVTSTDTWEHFAYRVTITYAGRTMRTTYSQGMAWPVDQVDPKDALGSLVVDFHSGEWDSFEGWCEDYGLDADSRRNLATYRALERNRQRMVRVFGTALPAVLTTFADR